MKSAKLSKLLSGKHRIAVFFNSINMIFLVLILIMVVAVIIVMLTKITGEASENYARFYSLETVNKFDVFLNKDLALVQKVSCSKAITSWFSDESNQDKKNAAYYEIMDYIGMVQSAYLYFGINESLNEYAVDKETELTDFVHFDVIDPAVSYNNWYFDCVNSEAEYTLNIDIDKATDIRRLWINHKVGENDKILGVFCSGLQFDQVIEELFGQYDANSVLGLIIDKKGVIQMDSSGEFSDDENPRYIYEANLDPVFKTTIDTYLSTIEGYFTVQTEPKVFRLDNGPYGYMSIAPIADTDWTAVILFNSDSLFSMNRLLPLLAAMLSAFVLYAAINGFLMRRLVFMPLNQLTGSISEAGDGRSQIYGVERGDEFGDLAQTIQNMRDRLNKYNAELLLIANERNRQSVLLHTVNEVATVLLQSEIDEFEDSLWQCMGMMARSASADRVCICKNYVKDGQLYCTQLYEWVEGSKPQQGKKYTENRSYNENMPGWEEKLSHKQCINTIVRHMLPEEQAHLLRQGVLSILVVPVYFQDQFWGFVGFEDCSRERVFSADEESILRSGSLLIANALLRNEMNQNIRTAASKMEAVIANYTGVIWSIDRNNVITLFNGLYLKELGITSDLLEGKNIDILKRNSQYLDVVEYAKKAFDQGPQDWISEIDSKMLYFHTTPIYDDSGQITGVVGSIEDITATIRLQKEFELAAHEAQAASRAKSEFLSNMSHEMRTPMNAIIGMTSIGKSAHDLERKDYAFGKIESASNHLLGVINDILDMSKIEANKFQLSEEEFSFEKMLQKVVNVIGFRIDEKKQHFTVHLDKDIPRTLIGDDQRLAQVITNLLSNAVKFTPEQGTILLNTHMVKEEDGICTIQIEVTDTGIGISAEQQSRLFTSFEQAESSTTRKFGGTGLGLAISKHIIESMNGEIWIESELGHGSTFAFVIRAKRGEGEYGNLLNPGINLSNMRVLIVDDAAETREYFANIAEQLDINCDTAADGEEALRLIDVKGSYSLYFVDWKMPGMNGIELSRIIREHDADKSVIIMISAAEWNEIEQEAKMAGVDHFLPKPLFPSTIADCINKCVAAETAVVAADAISKEPESFEGYCILLAEDMEINREIVLAMLEPAQLEIHCAENGIKVLQMFSTEPERYDMIFMDVQMPDMDGLEATRRIRGLNCSKAKEVPIVAMTANVFKEDIEKCLEAGMNDHVGKPLDFNQVMEKIKQYLPPMA